jgi:hypothetical protein
MGGGTSHDTERSRASRNTHTLESADRRISQDIERSRASKRGHSHSGERRGRHKSGQTKVSKRGALTNWRAQRETQVKIAKETERARATHELGGAEGGTSQNTEIDQASENTHTLGNAATRSQNTARKASKRRELTS